MMRRLIRVSTDPRQKVDLNYRLGKIFDEQMKEPEPAEEYLVEALSLDPAHVPSMLSLLGIYKRRGDWLKAAQLMVRAEAATANPLEKTRLLLRGGQDLPGEAGRRGAGGRAVRARPAARSRARRGGRAAVAALLQARGVGAAGADPRDAGAQGRSQDQPRADAALSPARQGGRPAGRQREGAQVLQAVLRPRLDLPADAARPRRRCSTSCEHWDDAFRIYQTILVHHRDTAEGRSRSSTSSSASAASS